MGKSYKKTPVTGNSAAESEKADKRSNNRKLRRLNRSIDLEVEEPAHEYEVSDAWLMRKDGKQYLSRIVLKKYPELVRK